MLFADWLRQQPGVATPRGGQSLTYTQDRATYREQGQGALSKTANPLDLSLMGLGFFTVETKAGPMLTRAGRFGLQPDGTVADAEGDALLDTQGRPIRVAGTDTTLTVSSDGMLSSENGQIGKIGIVSTADDNRMQAEGDKLLSAQSPTSLMAQPKIIQGSLESSNVEPIAETTSMMNELREFQFVSQFIEGESQRQQSAIDKLVQK